MTSSFDAVPPTAPVLRFWVRLRYHATGHEETYAEKTALNRALLITLTRLRADVVELGERVVHVATLTADADSSKP